MNVKTTLALLVLLIAIGAYFYFVEMDAPDPEGLGTDSGPSIKGQPLLPEDFPSPIDGSRLIVRRDGTTAIYQHLDTQWIQTEPVRVFMNNGSMERLVGNLLQLRYTQQLDPGIDDSPTPAESRLDPPLATVTYEADDNNTVTLRLGKKLLSGYGYAALEDDSVIHVVADRLHNSILDVDPNQWRKRTLDAPVAADQLIVRRGDDALLLHREDGQWFLGEDTAERADRGAVETLVAALAPITIDRFHADDPPDLSLYGLEQPMLSIMIRDAATQAESTLRVGGPTDLSEQSVFATWTVENEEESSPPVVFSIPRSSIETFEVAPDTLRDKRLFSFDALTTRQINIERDGQPSLGLARGTAGLVFTDPTPDFDVDRDVATAFIADVTGLATEAFVPGFTPTGEPIARIELLRRGTGTESASVYQTDEGYVALRDGETVGYALSEEQIGRLRIPAIVLRDRVVASIPEESIERLVMMRGPQTLTYVRNGDRFTLEGEGQADDARVGALVAALNPLYAESWPPSPGAVSYAIKPTTLSIQTTTGTLKLFVDTVSGESTLTGVDWPFMLPRETLGLLTNGLADRSVLEVAPETIESIRIEQDGKHFTMCKQVDGTIVADKAEHLSTLDQAMATKLFDAVAGLEVDDTFDAASIDLDADRAVLKLTVATTDMHTQWIEVWTQDNRMLARRDQNQKIVVLTEGSARALAFLFAESQTAP